MKHFQPSTSGTRAYKNLVQLRRSLPADVQALEPADGWQTVLGHNVLEQLHTMGPDQIPSTLSFGKLRDALGSVLAGGAFAPTGSTTNYPLFNGTLHFVQCRFNIIGPGGGSLIVPNADMQTLLNYTNIAVIPIQEYAAQYGPNAIGVSQIIIPFVVNLPTTTYNDPTLQGWVNQIAVPANGVGPNDCIIFVNPNAIVNSFASLASNKLGYHGIANVPYISVNLANSGGQALTLSDLNGPTGFGFYAVGLSHEIEEMAVDPLVNFNNPEVGDPCNGATNQINAFVGPDGSFLGALSAGTPFPSPFALFMQTVVTPASSGQNPAPFGSCAYAPPYPFSLNAVMAWKGVEDDNAIYFSSFDGNRFAPQARFGIPATATEPALALSNGRPIAVWRGVPDDESLYLSTFDSINWAPQQSIRGSATAGSPALVQYRGRTLMAWRGTGDDQQLWYNFYNGSTWSPQQTFGGQGSAVGPALTVFGDFAFMAWRGVNDDNQIYFALFDDINGWQLQQPSPIPGIGTATRPAVALFQGKVLMAWRGVGDDQQIWYSQYDGTNGWTPQQTVPGVGTSFSPSLVSYGGNVLMTWKGIDGDQEIYFSQFDGTQWSSQVPISGIGTSFGPALGLIQAPFMIWKGVTGDFRLWDATFYGANWLPQQNIGNKQSEFGPESAIFDGKIFSAWRGVATDQRIWFSSFDGNSWATSQVVAGANSSVGPALAGFGGRLCMAWKGVVEDQRIFYANFDGASWTNPAPIVGANTTTRPALCAFAGKLYMVWKGADGDQRIWTSQYDQTGWSAPQILPFGGTNGTLALTVLANQMLLAWKGVAGDERIWFSTSTDGLTWPPEIPIGGANSSVGPSLTTFGGRAWMAWKGVTGDQRLFTATFDGQNWSTPLVVPFDGSDVGPGLVSVSA